MLLAAMAVCVKAASAWFNSAELVFYRGLLGMLFLWLLTRGQRVPLATPYPAMHAWRSLVGVFSLGAWFSARPLPVASAWGSPVFRPGTGSTRSGLCPSQRSRRWASCA